MRPSWWNGVGAMAKVPAAWAVSFVMRASVSLWSFPDGPKDQTLNLEVPQYAIAYWGSMLSHRPGTTSYLNLRADFFSSSSEKNISLAWVTISSAFHPVNGGVQPSISIIFISRTPRGPETPSTLPVWSPDKSETMYSTAGAIPSGPKAAPGFSL